MTSSDSPLLRRLDPPESVNPPPSRRTTVSPLSRRRGSASSPYNCSSILILLMSLSILPQTTVLGLISESTAFNKETQPYHRAATAHISNVTTPKQVSLQTVLPLGQILRFELQYGDGARNFTLPNNKIFTHGSDNGRAATVRCNASWIRPLVDVGEILARVTATGANAARAQAESSASSGEYVRLEWISDHLNFSDDAQRLRGDADVKTVPQVWWFRGEDGTVVTEGDTLRINNETTPGTYLCGTATKDSLVPLPPGILSSLPIVVSEERVDVPPADSDSNKMLIEVNEMNRSSIIAEKQSGTIRLHCETVMKRKWPLEDGLQMVTGYVDSVTFRRDYLEGHPKPERINRFLGRRPVFSWRKDGVPLESQARIEITPTMGFNNATHLIAWQEVVISDSQIFDSAEFECLIRGDGDSDSSEKLNFAVNVMYNKLLSHTYPFSNFTILTDQVNGGMRMNWTMLDEKMVTKRRKGDEELHTLFLLTYYRTEKGHPESISNTFVLEDHRCKGKLCEAFCCKGDKVLPATNYTFMFSIVYRTPEYGGVRSPLTEPVTLITWDEVAPRALDLNLTAQPEDTVLVEWNRPEGIRGTVLGYVLHYYNDDQDMKTTILRGANFSGGHLQYPIKVRSGEKTFVRIVPETLAGIPAGIDEKHENFGDTDGASIGSFPFVHVAVMTLSDEETALRQEDLRVQSSKDEIAVEVRNPVDGDVAAIAPVMSHVQWTEVGLKEGTAKLTIEHKASFYMICVVRFGRRVLCRTQFVGVPPMAVEVDANYARMRTMFRNAARSASGGLVRSVNPIKPVECREKSCSCIRFNDTVKVQWNATQEGVEYQVQFILDGLNKKTMTTFDNWVLATDLVEGRMYTVVVTANSSLGLEAHPFSCYVIPALPFSAPGKFSVKPISGGAARVEWTRAAYRFKKIGTGWEIRIVDLNTTQNTTHWVKGPLESSAIIRGLEIDHVYNFSIAAAGPVLNETTGEWKFLYGDFAHFGPMLMTRWGINFTHWQWTILVMLSLVILGIALGLCVTYKRKKARSQAPRSENCERVPLKEEHINEGDDDHHQERGGDGQDRRDAKGGSGGAVPKGCERVKRLNDAGLLAKMLEEQNKKDSLLFAEVPGSPPRFPVAGASTAGTSKALSERSISPTSTTVVAVIESPPPYCDAEGVNAEPHSKTLDGIELIPLNTLAGRREDIVDEQMPCCSSVEEGIEEIEDEEGKESETEEDTDEDEEREEKKEESEELSRPESAVPPVSVENMNVTHVDVHRLIPTVELPVTASCPSCTDSEATSSASTTSSCTDSEEGHEVAGRRNRATSEQALHPSDAIHNKQLVSVSNDNLARASVSAPVISRMPHLNDSGIVFDETHLHHFHPQAHC